MTPEIAANVLSICEAPVFVVGVPRSGTTWLQRMILSHPQVCGGEESHFFCTFAPAIDQFFPRREPVGLPCYFTKDNFWEELKGLWRRTMKPVIEAKPTATILLEKTPFHADHMQRILDVFPAARFIHVIRDSRAVVASLLAASRVEFGRSWAPRKAFSAARIWKRTATAAHRFGATLPDDRYMEIHYEQLSAFPAAELARVLRFIGVQAGHDQVLQIVTDNTIERQRETASLPGLVRNGNANGWRRELSLWQKALVWAITRQAMAELGYSRQGWNTRPAVNLDRNSSTPASRQSADDGGDPDFAIESSAVR